MKLMNDTFFEQTTDIYGTDLVVEVARRVAQIGKVHCCACFLCEDDRDVSWFLSAAILVSSG